MVEMEYIDGALTINATGAAMQDGGVGDLIKIRNVLRDPSSWGQDHDRVPLSRLGASYTGRCITFAPLAPLEHHDRRAVTSPKRQTM